MLNGVQGTFVIKLNELLEFAKHGNEAFPDEVCEFLTSSFELEAVVVFNIEKNNSLITVGKSSGAKKNFSRGMVFECSKCKLLNENINYSLHSDSDCSIQISEFLMYEMCALLMLPKDIKLIFKIAKKTVFSKIDKDSIDNIVKLITPYWQIWLENRGGTVPSSSLSFSKIVSDTSQELRSNINSIIGNLSILSDENQSSKSSNYINVIKKNTQSMLLNLNDLNELSKAESNTLTNNFKKQNLNNIVEETISLFQNKIINSSVTYSYVHDNSISSTILIDEQKLRYILINLLYVSSTLSESGEITVKSRVVSNNKIRITISDTGKGLSQEILDKFFEPFTISRLDEFKNSSVTGLSLTLVRNYVNFLGGDITVSGEAGEGINFNFTFTFNGDVMPSLESTISQLPKPSSKNKVLVIEDDYATSKLLSNYLNKWGYDPTIVSTEQQALNIIASEQLLAVILDIELPTTNGLELLKKIHDHPNTKNVPVIVCSIEPEQQKAFMMGAVEYFIKPINYNYLVEVLTSYKLRKDSNILCVDDDLPTLNLVKQAIESAGFNAIAINISAEVMDTIRDKSIDLAIIGAVADVVEEKWEFKGFAKKSRILQG